MEFTFENQGTATYLVYQLKEGDELDSMDLGMITNNKIPGFAPTIFTQMDADKFIKFNVSAKISAKQMFSGQVNKKRLIGVFRGIINAILSAEDYMINPNSILLDLDYVYADVSTCETVVLCLPLITQDTAPRDLGMFFKTIMFSTQFDQTENCDHVAKIISYLNSTPVFSAAGFKELLDNLNLEQMAPPRQTQTVQPRVQQTVQQSVQKPVQPVQQSVQQSAQPVQQHVQQTVSQPVQHPVQKSAQPQQPVQTVNIPQPEKANVNIPNIPTIPQAATPATSSAPAGTNGGKKISMLDLLMHYSKENKELYEAQKAAAKGVKATPQASALKIPTIPNVAAPKAASGKQKGGFDIPKAGGPVVIPGQSAPAINSMNRGPVAPQQSVVQPQQTSDPMQQAQPIPAMNSGVVVNNTLPAMKSANFGDTTVLSQGGEMGGTTVLDQSMLMNNAPTGPYLLRIKNNEKVYLTKAEFKIGKERSFVDYFIADNPAVSRSHASIVSENGSYYIMDMNSTNHTYVNGGMIQSNVKTRLDHDTKIRLANEEFEFKMY